MRIAERGLDVPLFKVTNAKHVVYFICKLFNYEQLSRRFRQAFVVPR